MELVTASAWELIRIGAWLTVGVFLASLCITIVLVLIGGAIKSIAD